MKVLAINTSPAGSKSLTDHILLPFIDGLKTAEAQVDLYYTKNMRIKSCKGDFACWFDTPGVCKYPDDMAELLPKIRQCDLLVLASPIHCDAVTGPAKNLLDRTIPLILPSFNVQKGHSRHPLRKGVKKGSLVYIGSCGLYEKDNFDPIISHMQAFCRNMQREFAGALLRPHSLMLKRKFHDLLKENCLKEITQAAERAGEQLVQKGCIPETEADLVSREMISLDGYLETMNALFDKFPDDIDMELEDEMSSM